MGFSSQGGAVTFRSQTVAGTWNADTLTAGIGTLLRTGSLGTNRDLRISDPEIGGGRDVVTAYLGSVMWSGDYEFYVRMEMLKTLIKCAFGTAGIATTTGVSTTTATPSDTASLPLLSIHEEIGAGLEAYNYNDGVVNSLALNCDANAYFMGTAGIIAKNQVAGVTTGVATTVDNSPMTNAENITVTYNSVAIPVKSFSFTLANNIEDSDFRVGSFFLGDLSPKRRDVTANFQIRETSSALWRQATLGLAASTTVGGVPTAQSLVIAAQTWESIPAGVPTTSYGLTLTIPKYILSPYSLTASGDDIIESGVDGRAVRPAVGTPICTAVVKGGLSTIA